MELEGTHWIAGRRSAEGSERFQAVDPTTGETLEPGFPEATSAEIAQAADAAEEAFTALAALAPSERAQLLETIADEIFELGDPLLERLGRETALPPARLTGERGRTVGQLRLFAELLRDGTCLDARIDTALPDREPLPRPDLRRVLRPLGPVAVFGASNFPLAFSVAGGDTASALAAGCPVVVKGHPAHPGGSELVAAAVAKAVAKHELPGGAFSLVHGASPRVGEELVDHPSIKSVGFTGSLRAGRALFDRAAARPEPIPVHAEMGSSNPVFFLTGVLSQDPAALAAATVGSLTLGAGQFCTNPGMLVVPTGAEADGFREALVAAVSDAPTGTAVHAGIAESYRSDLQTFLDTPDVELLAGTVGGDGAALQPALLGVSATTLTSRPHLLSELYGPATLLITADSTDAMTALAAALPGQLTATLHATDDELAGATGLLSTLSRRAGRLVLRGFPTGVEVSPAMHHGGPYPASSDERTTSVGTAAIARFLRPTCWQDFPDAALPPELRDDNPLGLLRLVNGQLTREPVTRT
ncbi:MAG: aldehyde dehydrogenase (NADP(+)) [Acidobacteriota bacterium]